MILQLIIDNNQILNIFYYIGLKAHNKVYLDWYKYFSSLNMYNLNNKFFLQ